MLRSSSLMKLGSSVEEPRLMELLRTFLRGMIIQDAHLRLHSGSGTFRLASEASGLLPASIQGFR